MERTRWAENLEYRLSKEREPGQLWKDASWGGRRQPHEGATKTDLKVVRDETEHNQLFGSLLDIYSQMSRHPDSSPQPNCGQACVIYDPSWAVYYYF